MKHWLPFILLLFAASAFAHVPERRLNTTLKDSQLSTLYFLSLARNRRD